MIKFICYLAVGAGCLFIGVILGHSLPRNPPFVEVLVKNEAAQLVRSIRLDPERGGSYMIENLAPGESIQLMVYTTGESSYKLKATFANGRVIEGGAGYIEPGYKMTEAINDKKIESAYRSAH